MAIVCPYCHHRLSIKSQRLGQYRPKCPHCAQPFLLIISDDPAQRYQVRVLLSDTRVHDPKVPLGASQAHFVLSNNPPPPVVGLSPSAAAPLGESHVFGFARTNPDLEDSWGSHRSPHSGGGLSLPAESSVPLIAPASIRGYLIEREIGRGGMGTVYLAKQLSLDRPVALKVMSKKWASDPVFVARFTREAFAAAQLSHPNIVQIHDIGESEGARFFSMEYVRGPSLAEMVKKQGKLDPEIAVGYVLQAARGLKHAHDRGMIHRDVKPDNLLLDEHGLIKVADLGLVKTPALSRDEQQVAAASSRSGLLSLPPDMTGAKIALGTPAYMSPEQCRDAASVDHRADIYSLGCTLYVLVTGRPPFEGTTAVELMSKHAYDPLVPPEQIVSRVPKEVSAIIQRMMAKDPNDRYQDMGEVIRTLEAWLGVHHTGKCTPQDEQITRLEGYVHQFNHCPPALLRSRLICGFFGTIALASVLLAFFGKLSWAFGLWGLALETTLAYFFVDGVTRRGHLFTCTRRFIGGMHWGDLIMVIAGFAIFCLLLAVVNVFWMWVGFAMIGLGLALALRYGVDRPLHDQRRPVIEACERQLRRMRLQGWDEDDLRLFVAKFAGRNWEEFFETLFGYEAKLAARGVLQRGGVGGIREKHAAWREPLIAWMEAAEKARKEARQRKLLAEVEKAKLLAVGASRHTAENQAQAAAEAMVRAAKALRQAETGRASWHSTPGPGQASVHAVYQAAEHPNDFVFTPTAKPDPFGRLVNLVVGPHVRAVAAAILLAACALWVHQNQLWPGRAWLEQVGATVENRDWTSLPPPVVPKAEFSTQPLSIPGVPNSLTEWVDSFNVGLAGLLLFGSLCFRGHLMGIFALVGAAVIVAGHHGGIRPVEPLRDYHVSLLLGTVLTMVGFRLGMR
ncbi:MAG: protein kinase [Gemmataceae bacterium]|nr:protein kinase [Gemmata sp.]MDW8199094.1 protein kinase [Gemmataceae bacterium]